ncbi:MAG: hypothetical protein BWY89_01643 [Bacteroidetes bacterium ADurb.BinA012]|nr:MAG: hypothetical protein BWY89_01643 [Bacteroidetes bacterium ADurb.BinA012]
MRNIVHRGRPGSRIDPYTDRIPDAVALLIATDIKCCRDYNIGDKPGCVTAVVQRLCNHIADNKPCPVGASGYLRIAVNSFHIEFQTIVCDCWCGDLDVHVFTIAQLIVCQRQGNPGSRFNMDSDYYLNSIMAGRITGFALYIRSESVGYCLVTVRAVGKQVRNICYLVLAVGEGAAEACRIGYIQVIHHLAP